MDKPKSFREVFNGQNMDNLERLIERGTQLARIDKLLKKSLPAELRPHCQLANIKGNTLILLANSTVWASRIRYQGPQLLKTLQQNERFKHITELQLRIQPQTGITRGNRIPRQASMSSEAASYLQQFAESVDDADLRSALERLASRRRAKT